MEYSQSCFFNSIRKILNVLMLVLFLPVLFCVMFIGNNIDYWDEMKANILVPNVFLSLVALVAFGICLWLMKLGRRVPFTKRTSRYLDLILVILFTGFFFFCMWVSGEIVFNLAADYGIVREAAKDVAHRVPFGYQFIFSIFHNNLPITYVLGQLYRMAENWPRFGHNPEYLWVIVGCLLVTGAGFCCCEIVKKLTKNPVAVLIAFALYLVTAGLSPWKVMPYTDSYGIFFPVLCVLLYLCSRDCGNMIGKVLWLFFSFLAGMAGGFMKPSAYIAVLAVLGAEGISFIAAVVEWKRNRRNDSENKKCFGTQVWFAGLLLLFSLLSIGILYGGTKLCKNYIIKDMQLDYNEEMEATAQFYFFIGTNELTTGSYSTEDYGIFGEFQYSKADRNAACMERAWERIRERGALGTSYFCLKKLVKSFNDGTFAWTNVRPNEPFPENLMHDNVIAGYVRSFFLPEGPNQAKYDTLAELVWIFTLIGVSCIVLGKKRRDCTIIFPIMIIGILSYLILFESGARYLYIFLPVFISISVCGMDSIEI